MGIRVVKFRTRVEGHRAAHRVWVCLGCRVFYDHKPPLCPGCKSELFQYFPSKGEAQRFKELLLLQDNDVISDLNVHREFPLDTMARDGAMELVGFFVPDFQYTEGGEFVIEDFKGTRAKKGIDPLWDWKRRHFEVQYGITVRIVARA